MSAVSIQLPVIPASDNDFQVGLELLNEDLGDEVEYIVPLPMLPTGQVS